MLSGRIPDSIIKKMKLIETYRKIKPSIVAITHKYDKLKEGDKIPEIPFILGTGFIVDDGLIATNFHVSNIIDSQPKPPDAPKDEWPVICMMFIEVNESDFCMIPLKVIGKFEIGSLEPNDVWYGDMIPDIAFLQVKAKGLPILKLQSDWHVLKEGMELATAGFPMGRDTLTAPGYLHQMGPTLQKGILSALLPFPRTIPHAFILDVLSINGQSGSPVFLPETGEVVGILYGGLPETAFTKTNDDEYLKPTSITYVLPAGQIEESIKESKKMPDFQLPDDTLSLEEILNTYPRQESKGTIRDYLTKNLSTDIISIMKYKT